MALELWVFVVKPGLFRRIYYEKISQYNFSFWWLQNRRWMQARNFHTIQCIFLGWCTFLHRDFLKIWPETKGPDRSKSSILEILGCEKAGIPTRSRKIEIVQASLCFYYIDICGNISLYLNKFILNGWSTVKIIWCCTEMYH